MSFNLGGFVGLNKYYDESLEAKMLKVSDFSHLYLSIFFIMNSEKKIMPWGNYLSKNYDYGIKLLWKASCFEN